MVRGNLRRHGIDPDDGGVRLIRSLFDETLHPVKPIALAHIDADWYEPVRICLERITPHLVPGGVLVIDDYDDWTGCRLAVDKVFADKREEFRFERRSRLHVVRREN